MNWDVSQQIQETQRLVFTVVTRNHFHYAAALARNVHAQDPDCLMVVVVADLTRPSEMVDQPSTTEIPDLQWLHQDHRRWSRSFRRVHHGRLLLAGQDVCDQSYGDFAFQYSALELTCALKSQAGHWLCQNGARQILYLDGDVRLFQSPEVIWQEMTNGQWLLTPHLRQRLPEDGRYPNNIDLLRTGNFNAGVWAVRWETEAQQTEVLRMLSWWRDCCRRHCIVDPHDGLFVDQKWLDQAVSISPEVRVSRNPGLNVGYWNLHEYDDESTPLTAFHFSGADNPEGRLSTHQNRHHVKRGTWLEQLLDEYRHELEGQSKSHYTTLPYEYDQLVDGTEIALSWREAIRSDANGGTAGNSNPFVFYANPVGHRQLEQQSERLEGGRFQWQQEQLHRKIRQLRLKLDRQPMRRMLKFVKAQVRRA